MGPCSTITPGVPCAARKNAHRDDSGIATASGDDLSFVPPIAVLILLLLLILFVLARRSYRRHSGTAPLRGEVVRRPGRAAPSIAASDTPAVSGLDREPLHT